MCEPEISVTIVFMSEKKPRAAQSVSDMVRSLGAVGLLVGLLATFVWFTRTESEQVLREVDWKIISIGAQTRTQLPTLGPVGLDKSWVATSARLEEIGEEDVWRVGVVSPSTEFVSVIVSKADVEKIIRKYVNIESQEETTRVIGAKTYRLIEESKDKVLYITESGNNILIYSTANWDETTKFVESLKVPTK
ncbi:MAG: DUF4245 family protein [Actinobacteria bacterium]|nr:DUF4245 family protein [Actinomycetota bacterium]